MARAGWPSAKLLPYPRRISFELSGTTRAVSSKICGHVARPQNDKHGLKEFYYNPIPVVCNKKYLEVGESEVSTSLVWKQGRTPEAYECYLHGSLNRTRYELPHLSKLIKRLPSPGPLSTSLPLPPSSASARVPI